MKRIRNQVEFRAFAREIEMRYDWHEPDQKGIFASVEGRSFDNAGIWPAPELRDAPHRELHLIFKRLEPAPENRNHMAELAAVNLATLCSWATNS